MKMYYEEQVIDILGKFERGTIMMIKRWKQKGALFLCIIACIWVITGCSTNSSQSDEKSTDTPKQESVQSKEKESESASNSYKSDNLTTKTTKNTTEQTNKSTSQTATKSDYPRFNAKVIHVADGDTVTIAFNGKEEKVRLLLVDTPESVHPSKPVQPYGVESSNFTKKSLDGRNVEVELGNPERDKYGRLLAYLYIDGKMYNETLLEKGYARVAYVYVPNTRYVDEFRDIQDKARAKGIGIWSIENYADNNFETTNTQKSTSSSVPNRSKASSSSSSSSQSTSNTSPSVNSGSCNIKGNISSSGEKIYHMPDGAYYDRTKEEQMFCSTSEAEAAGFRPSMR